MITDRLVERREELIRQHEEFTEFINRYELELERVRVIRNQVEGGIEVIGGLISEFSSKEERPESAKAVMDEDVFADDASGDQDQIDKMVEEHEEMNEEE